MQQHTTVENLPNELLVRIWQLLGELEHSRLHHNRSACHAGKHCPVVRSLDYNLARVSERWHQVAKANPKLFTVVHIIVYKHRDPISKVETLLIHNSAEVEALVKLSKSERLYISITSASSRARCPTVLCKFTLRSMSQRVVSLAFNADNALLVHALADTPLPKVRIEFVLRSTPH